MFEILCNNVVKQLEALTPPNLGLLSGKTLMRISIYALHQ